MPPLSLLIKPASSLCNLQCKYCFYHSIANQRTAANHGIMSEELLEVIVRKAMAFADRSCTFAFQGGEPTLAGLAFFERYISLVKKYNDKGVQVHHAIQTNGLAIDDQWAEFLKENQFLVGVSLDGPKEIHDASRVDSSRGGSYKKVMRAMELLNKYQVDYNVLCVVNSNVARRIHSVYQFYKKQNLRYLQFIPCLDPLNEEPGGSNYSLKPERYTQFLKGLFDLWYRDITHGRMVSIRYFDNLAGMYMGRRPEACGMLGECQCQMVIEADGGVYPCDFYVLDEWRLGRIQDHSFEELRFSEASDRFIEGSKHWDAKCLGCRWRSLCRGGCRRNREPFEAGKPVLNYYCDSYQEFFAYAHDRFMHLASMNR